MKTKIEKLFDKSNSQLFISLYERNLLTDNSIQNIIYHDKLDSKTLSVNKKIHEKKISIIIPTYNRKEQLLECINSIMRQSYQNFEIIVVDDKSPDNSQKYIYENIEDDRLKYYVNKENSGAGFSRKFGYEKSTGDYIIFMDDDDYYIDDMFFEDAVNYLADPKVTMVCSDTFIKYEKENKYLLRKLNIFDNIQCSKYLLGFMKQYGKPNSTFSTIFKKSELVKANFDDLKMVNDASIYMRGLLSSGNVKYNEKIIGIYRIHGKNITNNLKSTFLIENLEEKYKIYEIIKNRNLCANADNWISSQIYTTVVYFISGSNPKNAELKKVYSWIKSKQIEYKFLIFKCECFRLKNNCKRIMKKMVIQRKGN